MSVIIRLRALAKDATLAAFTSAKPGRAASMQDVELELLRAENDRLSEALKEMAGELTFAPGKAAPGLFGPVRARVSAETKLEPLGRSTARSRTGGRTRGRATCWISPTSAAPLAGQAAGNRESGGRAVGR
ncbi:MAG: hypothetical protein M3076_10895 [Actinomycetota bacterium]|nr:hypothetical protein [Actinomycetota bacterium]